SPQESPDVLRQRHGECRPLAQLRLHADIPAEAAHQCADMGQAYALARLVLRARPPEEIEDALVILSRYSPTVIGKVKRYPPREILPGRDFDPYRPRRRPVFDRVVEQVAEDLLQRQTVRDDG